MEKIPIEILANRIWQFIERKTSITKWGLFQECKIVSLLENRLIKNTLLRGEK